MIDILNHENLTPQERRIIAQRALQSRPRFIKFESLFLTGTTQGTKFRSQVGIDYNTYITSALFNSTAWFGETGTDRIFLEMYSLYKQSLYRFNEERETLSSFVTFDARFPTSLSAAFDDRQREFMPFLIEKGDSLVVETSINIVPAEDLTARAVLAGFVATPDQFYPPNVFEIFNRSIERDIRFETFDIEVDHQNGIKLYRIQNDGFPRLLLGFGARGENDTTLPIANLQSEILITDLTRRLQFSEDPIPLENYAPRIPMSRDQHIYYLPTEYYLEPFANLQFEIRNNDIDAPYRLTAHTRTV